MALEEFIPENNVPILDNYKLQVDRVKGELTKFGLTQNQAKVFIYLGKYGPKTAPEVVSALQMPRTETYHLLTQLQNKGIITVEFSSPTVYSALPFDKAIFMLINSEKEKISMLAKKEEELTDLWETIPTMESESKDMKKEQLQMLNGVAHVNSKIKDMIERTETELQIFFTLKDLARFYHQDLLKALSKSRNEVKYIVSAAGKIPKFLKESDKGKIKIINNPKVQNQCFIVKDSDEVLIFLRNSDNYYSDVFACWTNSKSFVDSMYMLFKCCWERANDAVNANVWSGDKYAICK